MYETEPIKWNGMIRLLEIDLLEIKVKIKAIQNFYTSVSHTTSFDYIMDV